MRLARAWLLLSGVFALLGGLLHLAVPLGGSEWYNALGAPPMLAEMAQAGSWRPAITCIFIAVVLFLLSAYAFSGAGLMHRLPFLRAGLFVIGFGLLARGIGFIPIAIWNPHMLSGLCGRCEGANSFLVLTSALCILAGVGYVLGTTLPAARLGSPRV